MTPVEVADYARGAQDALQAEIIGMLRESDELGPVFDKLDGWRCSVSMVATEWVPLCVAWSRYTDDGQGDITLTVHIGNPTWVFVEKSDMGGHAGYVRNSGNARWSDINDAADAALVEFEKLKEGANV